MVVPPSLRARLAADLIGAGPRQHDRAHATAKQLGDDLRTLLGGLAGRVDRFGQPLTQRAVVVDAGEAKVGERQPTQLCEGVVGVHISGPDAVEQPTKGGLVHVGSIAARER